MSRLTFILVLLSFCSYAQDQQIDSLKFALKNARHDTTKCILYSALVNVLPEGEWQIYNDKLIAFCKTKDVSNRKNYFYRRQYATALNNKAMELDRKGEPQLALDYCDSAMALEEEDGCWTGIASVLMNTAYIFSETGRTNAAIESYLKSIKVLSGHDEKRMLASVYNSLGSIYQQQGDIPKALESISKSLAMLESFIGAQGNSDDQYEIGNILNNLGYIYETQKDPVKALEFYNRSLELNTKTGNKEMTAVSLNNIASIYREKNEIGKSMDFIKRCIALQSEVHDEPGLSLSLNNLGFLFILQENYTEAEKYLNQCLASKGAVRDKNTAALAFMNLGMISGRQKKYAQALEYTKKAHALGIEMGFPESIKNSAWQLYKINKTMGHHKEALNDYEIFVKMQDSVNNETTRKASIRSQLKYEYEKQAAADSVAHAKESEIKSAELSRQAAEIKAKKNQQYALFGGLFLVCLFSIFMYNRFKVTQKQKTVIEHQKEIVEEQKKLVEEKQKEVLDSIYYAKRIQLAQIPNEKRVKLMIDKLKK